MNQKFINLSEKTEKKTSVYNQPQTKRFSRKRSTESDNSVDSIKSRQTAIDLSLKINQFNPIDVKSSKIHLGGGDFIEHLANNTIVSKEINSGKTRYTRGRTNRDHTEGRRQSLEQKVSSLQHHNQALTAELEVRSKQLQLMISQCQMLKQSIRNEEQKRKKMEHEKRQLINDLSQKIKQLQSVQIDNKKLQKQKQYLAKQIQFLQKINYDDKTRNIQSYRERYLAKQLEQLRKQILLNKTGKQKLLQSQIKKIQDDKYSLQTLYKALKVEKQTLAKQLQRVRYQIGNKKSFQKIFIFNSEEYTKLRIKYNSCLDSYKMLKIEYLQLQKELNRSFTSIPQHLNSNSSLSIVLSSSSGQNSPHCNKQKKGFIESAKNQIMTENIQDKASIKKSLNSKLKEGTNEQDFKKTTGPTNQKKSLQILNYAHPTSDHSKGNLKSVDKKPDKRGSFFIDQQKLKIGVSKA